MYSRFFRIRSFKFIIFNYKSEGQIILLQIHPHCGRSLMKAFVCRNAEHDMNTADLLTTHPDQINTSMENPHILTAYSLLSVFFNRQIADHLACLIQQGGSRTL